MEKGNGREQSIIEHEFENQNLPLGDIFNLMDSDRNGQISGQEFSVNKEVVDFFDQIDQLNGMDENAFGEKENGEENLLEGKNVDEKVGKMDEIEMGNDRKNDKNSQKIENENSKLEEDKTEEEEKEQKLGPENLLDKPEL